MKRHIVIKGIIAAAILVLIGATGFYFFTRKNNETGFRTEKVTRGNIISTVTATGTVNAVTTVLVGTQVSGTIKQIYVDFNSPVKKGQLIARIDPALFQAQVDQAQANLFTAKANLQKAEASLVDSKRTLERNRELFAKNFIARSDLDTADTNNETNKAQVEAAKAQVKQAEASLNTARTNLAYTNINSPVDGTVVSRNVDVGQTVAASFQTPTLFTIAQDLTKMQIDTNVAEADIGKVKVDQDVEFSVDAYPDITFKGKVSQVRNAPITVQNVVTYDVVVNVHNPELKLKPGMTANVSVVVSVKKDVLRAPNAALRFRPSEKRGPGAAKEKGIGLWVLEGKDLRRVPVITGISDGIYTEIVTGVNEGQHLVLESLSKATNTQTQSSAPRMRF